MLKDGPSDIGDASRRIPILPPLSLADRIVTQHDEPAFYQANVGVLILRRHPRQRIVPARRDDGGKSPAAVGGHIQIAGHPEVGPALKHHVFDAISVFLCARNSDDMERRLWRKLTQHGKKLLAYCAIALTHTFRSLQKSTPVIP